MIFSIIVFILPFERNKVKMTYIKFYQNSTKILTIVKNKIKINTFYLIKY